MMKQRMLTIALLLGGVILFPNLGCGGDPSESSSPPPVGGNGGAGGDDNGGNTGGGEGGNIGGHGGKTDSGNGGGDAGSGGDIGTGGDGGAGGFTACKTICGEGEMCWMYTSTLAICVPQDGMTDEEGFRALLDGIPGNWKEGDLESEVVLTNAGVYTSFPLIREIPLNQITPDGSFELPADEDGTVVIGQFIWESDQLSATYELFYEEEFFAEGTMYRLKDSP